MTADDRHTEQKEKLIAAAITLGLFILFVAFLFFYRIYTKNPPFELLGESGIEMNFGTYNEGTGEIENNGIGEATSVVAEQPNTNSTTSDNNEINNDFENGEPVMNDTKSNTSPPVNTTVVTPPKPSNTNTSIINNFIKNHNKPGTNGGDGNSGKPGNEGVPDGNPNTNGLGGNNGNPNYIGNNGAGGLINLAGRKVLTPPCKVTDGKEEGIVVVTIKVDKAGNVTEADPNGRGTNTSSAILKTKARQAAFCAKFSPTDGMDEQMGTLKFVFEF